MGKPRSVIACAVNPDVYKTLTCGIIWRACSTRSTPFILPGMRTSVNQENYIFVLLDELNRAAGVFRLIYGECHIF